jgi:hypothetical protein
MNPTTVATLLCVAIGCASVAAARELTERTSSQQTLRFPQAAGRTLDVRTIEGAISVEGYDSSDVEVLVNKSISADSQDNLRAAEGEVTLDTSDDATTMRAIVRYPDQPTCGEKSAADLRMKTFNGGLYTDFDVQTLPTTALVKAERRDGMYVYRSTGFTTVRAGSGGPELTLDTLNGDVRVLKRTE